MGNFLEMLNQAKTKSNFRYWCELANSLHVNERELSRIRNGHRPPSRRLETELELYLVKLEKKEVAQKGNFSESSTETACRVYFQLLMEHYSNNNEKLKDIFKTLTFRFPISSKPDCKGVFGEMVSVQEEVASPDSSSIDATQAPTDQKPLQRKLGRTSSRLR